MAERIPTLGLDWSEKEEEIVRQGVAAGLSGDEIRQRLPVARSRPAVIGKAHRMGLSLNGARGRRYPTKTEADGSSPSSAARRPRPQPAPVQVATARPRGGAWPIPATATTLPDLCRRSCRWPVGVETGAQQLFCGETSPEGQSYCPTHQPVAGGQRRDLNRLWDGKGAAPRWARQ